MPSFTCRVCVGSSLILQEDVEHDESSPMSPREAAAKALHRHHHRFRYDHPFDVWVTGYLTEKLPMNCSMKFKVWNRQVVVTETE